MNNNHLPAGRGAHGGPPMGGMNGHPGGGNTGRGGGSRRGRNYNNGNNGNNGGNGGNYHYNNGNGNYNGNGRHNNGQHSNGHNSHNGHYNQYQNQGYPGYINGYPVPANNYASMPYMQGNGMANGYVPYQQGYGRGAPTNGQFAAMGPPMGMHGAMPPQPFVPLQQQPPQPFQPHVPPHPQPHLPQHMPPLTNNNFPRNAPQAPMIVSSAQHHQMAMPPAGRYPPGPPPNGFPPYPHAPLGANGLPMSLPPHIPPPAHTDYDPEHVKKAPRPTAHQIVAAPEFIPGQLPHSPASANAITTPVSGVSSQPIETPFQPVDKADAKESLQALSVTPSVVPSVAPSVAASDISVVPTFGDIAVEESGLFVPAIMPKNQPEWSSHPDVEFPSLRKARRTKKRDLGSVTNVDMPQGPADSAESVEPTKATESTESTATPQTPKAKQAQAPVPTSSPSAPAPAPALAPPPAPAPAPSSHPTSTNSTAPSAVPVVPALPTLPIRAAPATNASATAPALAKAEAKTATATAPSSTSPAATKENIQPAAESGTDTTDATSSNGTATPAALAAPAAPMSWAKRAALNVAAAPAARPETNGNVAVNGDATNGTNGAAPPPKTNTNLLAEAISTYQVRKSGPVAFIEPRGLTNSGNMCYMLAVLQGLTFCTPFYDFLDEVGQKAAHSFKSETPMLDAMIMYIREFRVIARAEPTELRQNLKKSDYDAHGKPFTPDFVHHATKAIPRFSSMIYGHQQDAEEFLGFLLESLNDECTKVVHNNSSRPTSSSGTPSGSATPNNTADTGDDGWLEVGHRQKTAVMQSSGHVSASPVNSIFVSQLRSELNAPGRQASVTVEPYQTLQLHIDSPDVHNIVDALRAMTVPEKVRVEGPNGPNGDKVEGSKRLHIQTLPPVLILHLKRFQFDSGSNGSGGSVKKISKKIGYPLQLDIPRELLSHGKSEPTPKYRLNAVVYHHGKQANGGHYTVDVLRSDESEWIRLDDTSIRRITKADIVEAGAKDPAPNKTNGTATNGNANAGQNGAGWSAPVNGNSKKWSTVAGNAKAPAPKAKPAQDTIKDNTIKDNKVAYLLFYQRIN